MKIGLLVHILAGALGLAFGTVAICAAKGERLHRKSGKMFVYAMVAMALSGAGIAALHGIEASVIGGVLGAYLVITALTTVRPPSIGSRWLDLGALLVALALGLTSVTLGLEALANGDGTRDGFPAGLFFMFGAIALLAGASDVRMLRAGGVRGTRRLARHLWRMCFAFFTATSSFFLGQADEFPQALRIPALLTVLALAPILVMLYWLWRLRIKRTPSSFAAFLYPSSTIGEEKT